MDLQVSLYDYADRIASYRSKQKEKYASSNPMSKNYELVGVLGELVFSFQTGQMMDTRLRAFGDNGLDFEKVQVKTSERHKAKHLIEYMDKEIELDSYYVFVIVDLEAKTGYIHGWISGADFIAKRSVVNFGYGDRYAVELTELNEWKRKKS